MWGEFGIPDPRIGWSWTLVMCEPCGAPLGLVEQPPADCAAELKGHYMERLVETAMAHHPAHPRAANPRINLLGEKDLGPPGTLANLLGRHYAQVMEGLPRR